jgi:methylene-fatty-acyl-phospholipid synthase
MAAFLAAGVLLSLERFCYVSITRRPEWFRSLVGRPFFSMLGGAVGTLRYLFQMFKGLQLAVFVAWCYLYGHGSIWPPAAEGPWLLLGAMLLSTGQALNFAVFHRLGDVGVFYGDRLGYDVPWCTTFPFSVLEHPQYVGAVLSVWGFFLIMRFPNADWYALPALETVYYALGAHLEK